MRHHMETDRGQGATRHRCVSEPSQSLRLGWFVAKQLITQTLFRDSHLTDNKMEV